MRISVSNKIYVHDASPEVFEWCRNNLQFPNPEYAKKQNMGLWLGDTLPEIVLWERRGKDAILPYGCLWRFLSSFPHASASVDYKVYREGRLYGIAYGSKIDLFDYQKTAADCVRGASGVLVMPCGSGKTQTALSLVASYGARTLWITHTQDLLMQSRDRALSCFEIDERTMGTITAGKVNVGSSITFATVQTLSNIDLEPYKDYWDVVIVDECHKAVGTPTKLMMFYKVVSQLSALIKLGLTATPKRNDGLERCMYALLGEKLYEVPEEAVAKNTVPIRVQMWEDGSFMPDSCEFTNADGTINPAMLTEAVCKCSGRNQEIARIVQEENRRGNTVLVLSDRVQHLTDLRALVGEDYTEQVFSMGASKKARSARREMLDKLKRKELRCVFATYQLAKEGLDIPTLNTVILATPKKDSITVIQSCGRVGRKAPGKNVGIVYDIIDTRFPMFMRYARKRQSMYKTKKYTIINKL